MKNERTSKRVASIAARTMKRINDLIDKEFLYMLTARGEYEPVITKKELESILGSVLPQVPDRPRKLANR